MEQVRSPGCRPARICFLETRTAWSGLKRASPYRLLEPLKLPVVPRLLEEWRDQTAYPYPFAVVSRLPGTHPADASDLIDPLYRFVAQWHDLEPAEIHGSRPPAHHDRADNRWLRRALEPRTARDAVAEAADRLHCESRVESWSRRMEEAAKLSRVVVHGDIHEDQLLVVDGQLTGILDWETTRIDHPFWDFDFSQWGTELLAESPARGFTSLVGRVAVVCRPTRHGSGSRALETAFRLRHALFLLDDPRDPSVAGTIEEHLAAI